MGMQIILLLVISLFLSIYSQSKANLTEYCAVPPTIGYSVSPNIMLVLQDDARMRWRAYCYDNDGDSYCDNSFDPNYMYDGYFEPDKYYRWNGSYWEKTSFGIPASCPERNNIYPLQYKETLSSGAYTYTLDYAVLPGTLKIYSIKILRSYYSVYDDGLGVLRRTTDDAPVGSILYSTPLGVAQITFYSAPRSSFDVYYSYLLKTINIYTGSCLNYHYMTRIDIVRLLLTGGSPRSCPTSYLGSSESATPQYCDPRRNTVDRVSSNEILLKTQDFEDWDLRWAKNICWDDNYCIRNYTFKGVPVKTDLDRVYKAILYKQAELDESGKAKPRIGLITYDTAWPVIHPNKVYIGDFRTSITDYNKNFEYQNVITSLNANRDLLPWIPSYSCKTAAIWDAGNSMAPALWDVHKYFSQIEPLYCGLSPSTSTYDKWRNPLYQCINFDSEGNCIDVAPAPCSKNFIILLTEGMWNIGSDSFGNLIKTCRIDDGFEQFSSDPTVPIYWMHKKGMSNEGETVYIDKTYILNIWPYSSYGKNASKLMAIFGSFDTQNEWPEGYDGYPYATCDLSAFNDAFTNCRGSLCETEIPSGIGYSWDLNNDGTPDTYFEVNTVDDLRKALETAFSDIQKNISSSSTTTLLSGRNDKGAILEQVVFYPEKYFKENYRLSWIGQLFTFWYYKGERVLNIREDTNRNKQLDVLEDNVVQYYLDNYQRLNIKVCKPNYDGSASNICRIYYDINDLNYLIEVGKVLADTDHSDRIIYSVDKNNQLRRLTPDNKDYFNTLIGTNLEEFPDCLTTDGNIDYEKVINYLLGEQILGCRNKTMDEDGRTWKLADIMHSSPEIVSYEDYDVVFTASNDGILHAFKIGKYQAMTSPNTVAELTGGGLGEELWGFVPKNALPYIRYLADPNYCHIYLTDLKPYIFEIDYNGDGKDEKILIGGFRLGGGCGCLDGNCIKPPLDTCLDPSSQNCLGLSSYYALDITDPEEPIYLWEFTHPNLYFTYSGPAVVRTKDNNYHIVFASGPINYSAQYYDDSQFNITLKLFVVDLKTGYLERVIDTGIQKAFAGRLFTKGLDYNKDGYTDYLAIGYTRQDGSNTNFKGGVILLGGNLSSAGLSPFSENVNSWDFLNITNFGTDIGPVVSKIEFMECFGRWYMYFGTGRWFKNIDDWEAVNNTLFGIPLEIVRDSYGDEYLYIYTYTEDLTDPANAETICSNASNGYISGWRIYLENTTSSSLKEKNITDPITTPYNVIMFATIKPVKDICGLGGNTRVWLLNCATGGTLQSCPLYSINPISVQGNLLLQLSGGNIQEVNVNQLASSTNSRTTNWIKGIAPEGAPPLVKPYKNIKGQILLWLEK